MKSVLLKTLLSADNKKINERKQRRKAKAKASQEKAKTERKLWEIAEEYEQE